MMLGILNSRLDVQRFLFRKNIDFQAFLRFDFRERELRKDSEWKVEGNLIKFDAPFKSHSSLSEATFHNATEIAEILAISP